MRQINWAEK